LTEGRGPLRFLAAPEDEGVRLDVFLAGRLELSRSRAQRFIRDGRVAVEGVPEPRPSRAMAAGETVECREPEPDVEHGLEAQRGTLRVLYEDDALIVLDKTPDVAVHPGAGRADRTLVNFLLDRFPEIAAVGHPRRPGIVHRLDLGTSGVLAVARTDRAYQELSRAFAERAVRKLYLAIAYGQPEPPAGEIDDAIVRDPKDRKRMTIVRAALPRTGAPLRGRASSAPTSGAEDVARSLAVDTPAPSQKRGRQALTLYRTLATGAGLSLLELDLRTGRTHQIRVHLRSRGLPLVGDPVYGEARWRSLPRERQAVLRDFPRPALHAWRLTLPHPSTGATLTFEAPVPSDLCELWTAASGSPLPLLDRRV